MRILKAKTTGWAIWKSLISCDGIPLTRLRISLLRSRGSFEVEGTPFTAEPEGFFGKAVVLRKRGGILARAELDSLFRRSWRITSAGHRLFLVSRSWMGRDYEVLLEKETIGFIEARGFFRRDLTLELPGDMPEFLQIFLAFLTIYQAKREASGAAAAGA